MYGLTRNNDAALCVIAIVHIVIPTAQYIMDIYCFQRKQLGFMFLKCPLVCKIGIVEWTLLLVSSLLFCFNFSRSAGGPFFLAYIFILKFFCGRYSVLSYYIYEVIALSYPKELHRVLGVQVSPYVLFMSASSVRGRIKGHMWKSVLVRFM